MPYTNRVYPLILKDLDTLKIGPGTWSTFDLDGTEQPCFMIRLTNYSNTTIFISFNGSDVADIIRPYKQITYNFQLNSCPQNYKSQFKKYSKVYIRGAAGIGKIYLSGYYNEPHIDRR